MAVLVTGGAGYIGSHCLKALRKSGFHPIAADNLIKGHRQSVQSETLYIGDIADGDFLDKIFSENKIECVMHFAAFSLVGESMENPYEYYNNNVCATLNLLKKMVEYDVKYIIFSSTAATYGIPEAIPITENHPQMPINVYGETKLVIEKMLKWFDYAYGLKYVALRYFNVAGADESGEIGEDHHPETHLIPIILSVAVGVKDKIIIYGDDYNTSDGSCIRDYIHVDDLSDAHLLAYKYLKHTEKSDVFNLGSGGGYSNFEILTAARNVTGEEIPHEVGARRNGDPDILIASSEKAYDILGWRRKYDNIEAIIDSAWRWHKTHPTGYGNN